MSARACADGPCRPTSAAAHQTCRLVARVRVRMAPRSGRGREGLVRFQSRPAWFVCLRRLRFVWLSGWLVAARWCISRRRSSYTTSSCTPQSCTLSYTPPSHVHALPPSHASLSFWAPARERRRSAVVSVACARAHIPAFSQVRAGCHAGPAACAGPLRRHVLRKKNPPRAAAALCSNGCATRSPQAASVRHWPLLGPSKHSLCRCPPYATRPPHARRRR